MIMRLCSINPGCNTKILVGPTGLVQSVWPPLKNPFAPPFRPSAIHKKQTAEIMTAWRSPLVACLLAVLSHVAGAGSRDLLQEMVSIEGRTSGAEVMGALEPGQVVELAFDKLVLKETWRVDVENVRIRGPPDGLKPIIKCPPDGPAFEISASNVSLERIIFEGCKNVESVVSVKPLEDPNIPAFERNTSVLLISGIVFSEVDFRDNQGISSDFGYIDGGSSIDIRQASVSVFNCKFTNNTASMGGAIIMDSGLLYVRLSEFKHNKATDGGGAIRIQRQAKINDTLPTDLEFGLNISSCEFEGNLAVADFSVDRPIARVNGEPLESLVVYSFPEIQGQGGALWIGEVDTVVIEDSTFNGNKAPSGGAIYFRFDPMQGVINGRGSLEINNCSFLENIATYPEPPPEGSFPSPRDEDHLHGGSFFGVIGIDNYEVEMKECTFKGNKAASGGAIHIVTGYLATIKIDTCDFESNTATSAGGAAVFRNTAAVGWYNNIVRNCKARIGGGVLLTNNAGMTILGPDPLGSNGYTTSVFEGNMAIDGAGLMCALCGATVLQGPHFINNRASRNGGGLAVMDAVTDMYVHQGVFYSNIAMRGGGAYVDTANSLRFTTVPQFKEVAPTNFTNNRAVSGGGLMVIPRSLRRNDIEITGVFFEDNTAEVMRTIQSELERIHDDFADDNSLEALEDSASIAAESESADCGLGGGGGVCIVLDLIPETSTVKVFFDDCKFTGNYASVGGGVHLKVSKFEWQPEECERYLSPNSVPCRSFQLVQPLFKENIALLSGGGLFVSDPTKITIPKCTEGLQRSNEFLRLDELWRRNLLEEYCFAFDGNMVEDGQYGDDMASRAVELQFLDSWGLLANQTSGEKLQPDAENPSRNIRLRVVDHFNQTVTGGFPEAEADIVVISTGIISQLTYKATKGIVDVNNTNAIGEHKDHVIEFSCDGLRSTNVTISIRDCYPGEAETQKFKECIKCEENQYSFIPHEGCIKCESKAKCYGGASLVPDSGYWHSSPYSPNIHICILEEACSLEGRTEKLLSYTNVMANLTASNAIVPNDEYPLCAKGYRGVLCGSCEESYGHLPGGQCVECQSRKSTVVWMTFIIIWSVILVTIEIVTSISANKDFLKGINAGFESILHGTKVVPEESLVPQEMQPVPSQPEAGGNGMVRSHVQVTHRQVVPEDHIPDHVEAFERLSETIKIFVNYLQVTSLAITINLSWESLIKWALKIQEVMAGLSNGSTVVPLDCTFDENSSTPRSILAIWFRIGIPFVLLVFFLLICTLCWTVYQIRQARQTARGIPNTRGMRNNALDALGIHNLYTYWIIITIAIAFFAYNGITEELMRTVNCVEMEEYSDGINPFRKFALVPSGRVWAEDTSLTCFQGQHLWTGVVGALGLLFFSVGFIVFITVLLWSNKHKINDLQFLSRYGFLYRAYKTDAKTVYWEAVVTLRKGFIGAVVVFAYPLGPNLQAILAVGVLILALVAQMIWKPFKEFRTKSSGGCVSSFDLLNSADLNLLEAFSLVLSLIMFYSGVVFNDPNTSETGSHTLMILVFAMHALYFFYMLFFRIWGGLHVAVDEKIKSVLGSESGSYDDSMVWFKKLGFIADMVGKQVAEKRRGSKGQVIRGPGAPQA